MTTDGGGWTLVAKVNQQSTVMNYVNTAQWRDATLLGDTSTLTAEDALGAGYSNVGFTDVMLQSLTDSSKSVGWRHDSALTSAHAVVQSCTKTVTTNRLFGTIGGLDMTDHAFNEALMNECSPMYAGFFTHDSSDSRTMAGCSGMASGYAGAVIGIGHQAATGGCVTSFGVGSSYGGGVSGNQGWAINYHWWNAGNWRINGNADSGYFYALGVFVR